MTIFRRNFLTGSVVASIFPFGLGAQSQPGALRSAVAPDFVSEPQNILSDPAISAAIDEIKRLPFQGLGIISGEINYNSYFSRLLRLDIAPSSKLIIGLRASQNRIFICAEDVFVQCPPSPQHAAVISYQLLDSLAPAPRPKARDGRSGAPKTGQNGEDGENGVAGESGRTYDAPTLFFVFKRLTVQNAIPGASTLLKFDMNGINGGNGGRGGDGGNAGNGASGTDARNDTRLGIEVGCAAGPGRGGDTGKPGSGGKGGDAGRGGNGGHVVVICPASEAQKVAFAASLRPGLPGAPGQPGSSGRRANAGSGGDLTSFCRDGRPGGNVLAANPENFGPGAMSVPGNLGAYQVYHRDTSDVFSF